MCGPTLPTTRSKIWSMARSTIRANALRRRASVDGKVYDEFAEGFPDLTRNMSWQTARSGHDPGPMARGSPPTRCAAKSRRRGKGAGPVNMKVDGDRPGSPYLAPEVLTNVNHQMEVMREEASDPSSAS
jgi:acyl-CoA reductase-like NAD-dependent aldehyde dehydrogenase